MRALLASLAFLIACDPTTPPPATTTTPQPAPTQQAQQGSPQQGPQQSGCDQPAAGQPMTEQQCTCLGAKVHASRGGTQEHCPSGQTEVGSVRFGIEGGWCCKAP